MVRKTLISIVTMSILLGTNAVACPSSGGIKACSSNSCAKKAKHCIVRQVTDAVSKTGLSAKQTAKVAQGIKEYRATKAKIKQMQIFPIDSFIDDKFDEKRFIGEMSEKHVATIAAKAALFKYIFSILDTNQRDIFKREYAAPLIQQMIKRY